MGFRDWPTSFSPFAPGLGVLGGRRGPRRAARQINGGESYDSSDLARLRAIARYRLALATRGSGGAARAGSVSLIAFFAGTLLRPSNLGPMSDRVFQVLAIGMIVVLLVSLPFTRRRTDVKAQVFLARTAPEKLSGVEDGA